mmetsp:Transcript_35331/g.112951  ORF Transcript_35331/g.112951 Transcript_35331/m.112951 type:complete len:229 (+) Transcript_35331:906-1592(+)
MRFSSSSTSFSDAATRSSALSRVAWNSARASMADSFIFRSVFSFVASASSMDCTALVDARRARSEARVDDSFAEEASKRIATIDSFARVAIFKRDAFFPRSRSAFSSTCRSKSLTLPSSTRSSISEVAFAASSPILCRAVDAAASTRRRESSASRRKASAMAWVSFTATLVRSSTVRSAKSAVSFLPLATTSCTSRSVSALDCATAKVPLCNASRASSTSRFRSAFVT